MHRRAAWRSASIGCWANNPSAKSNAKVRRWGRASGRTASRPRRWRASRAPAVWRSDALQKMHDGKAEYFVFRTRKAGEALDAHLAGVVQAAIKELPIPKLMRWGEREDLFVRPVHGLILLHGSRVVPGEVLGLKAGNSTRGHRFVGQGEIRIEHARDYASVLEQKGAVVASFDASTRACRDAASEADASIGGRWYGHSNVSAERSHRLLPGETAAQRSVERGHRAGREPGGLRRPFRRSLPRRAAGMPDPVHAAASEVLSAARSRRPAGC